MSRGLTFELGGFYHAYNRGTEKRLIFVSKADYDRFMLLLYHANSVAPLHLNDYRSSTSGELFDIERGEPLVDICAHCLMPNHFHLLIHESVESGISRFMHKLLTGYTMYFNARYERTGALFQGKFKAQDANGDRYLKYLISYIHLNPVKLLEPHWKESGIKSPKRAEEFLETYTYSSYPDYCGQIRPERRILNQSVLPTYFNSPKDFKEDVTEWLRFPEVRPRD